MRRQVCIQKLDFSSECCLTLDVVNNIRREKNQNRGNTEVDQEGEDLIKKIVSDAGRILTAGSFDER